MTASSSSSTFFRSVAWSAMNQFGKQGLQLVLAMVLARLLKPSDYGVTAIAFSISAFVSVLGEMGVSSALVQNKSLQDQDYSTVFWLNFLVNSVFVAGLALAAPFIGAFYNLPYLTLPLQLVALSLVFTSLGSIQSSLLIKDLRFKRLFFVEVSASVLAGIFAVALAMRGFGYWSIVGQCLMSSLAMTGGLWLASSWRPRWSFDLRVLRMLWRFSGNMLASNLANYFFRNLDTILIGKFLGPVALGYYNVATKLMTYPLRYISESATRVMFPAFATYQEDNARIRTTYVHSIQSIALFTFPLMTGVMITAPELIELMIGSQWRPAIPMVQILAFAGMLQSIGTTVGSIYLAKGRPDMQFRWSIFAMLMTAASIMGAIRWGILTVAISYASVATLLWLLSHLVANRLIELKLGDFLSGGLLDPMRLTALMAALIWPFHELLRRGGVADPLVFVVTALAGMGVYGLLAWSTDLYLVRLAKRKLQAKVMVR